MSEKFTKEDEKKLDQLLKAAAPLPPAAPSDEWDSIHARLARPSFLRFPGLRLLAPVAMAAVLVLVLLNRSEQNPRDVPVEAYLIQTHSSLYQGEIDEALGEWAYLVDLDSGF